MKPIVDSKYEYLLGSHTWSKDDNGYPTAGIKWNGKWSPKRMHIVIICTELGITGIPDGSVIHHKNENKWDNRIENLEVMSRAEHISHHHAGKPKPYMEAFNKSEKKRASLRGNTFGEALGGDANGRSLVSDELWLTSLEDLFKGVHATNAALARHLGIQKTQVGYVLNGKSRKHLQPQIIALKAKYNR